MGCGHRGWYPCQSIFWSVTTPVNAGIETDHKCAVSIDTSTSDIFLDTSSSSCTFECLFKDGENHYNVSLSSTGQDLSLNVTADFGFGKVSGNVVSDSVSVSGFTVSHGA